RHWHMSSGRPRNSGVGSNAPSTRANSTVTSPDSTLRASPTPAGRNTDPTPLLGWAGWDHAEQALALGRIVTEREAEGWAEERLVALVAGLAELQPWVSQGHAELHPVYGVSLGAYCEEELSRRCVQVGRTRAQLAAWRPVSARRGRPGKRAT
ncbi:MAG: hypothetical protein LC799_10115, partial [Actinobacteria bacterium]|nr:hypothetical protein [Actinomycetota bacterium]